MNLEDLPLFNSPKPEQPKASPEEEAYSVAELTALIKGKLEGGFKKVLVRGEVSNLRPSAAGHIYFTLKDDQASLSAAVFGFGRRKRPDIKDGMEVLCHGKISVYAPRGSYQLIVDKVEPLGAGALQAAFDKLKAKLHQEGLFDPKLKRPLPVTPNTVLVVTSPTGAALKDMVQVLGRRAPQIKVVVIPALVQGDGAPAQIIAGLKRANSLGYGDLIVLARGGGSLEDLWCFNDEGLAREIRRSRLPVISAVGHEIDFTISDFVADHRAPTPSAGAEILSQGWVRLIVTLEEVKHRLMLSMKRTLQERRQMLQHVAARLVSPRDKLNEQAQRCDEWAMRLNRAISVTVERNHSTFQQLMGKLEALSPLRVLARGYSLVQEEGGGQVIQSAKQVSQGQRLQVKFSDGEVPVQAL